MPSLKTLSSNRSLILLLLSLIFATGIGLRAFHHSDWLILKSDQARDAIILDEALENGFSRLPLLGPEAGSTGFRLGPLSYYFQYVSGLLFGQTIESLAYPDLVFGILAIPAIIALLRLFTPLPLALFGGALASVSFFLITFSRFAWNPNPLPFFTAAFAWSFLSALKAPEQQRRFFLLLSVLLLGAIAHLHLVALVSLCIGLSLFVVFTRVLTIREIILGLCIFLACQFPVFLSEYRTHGDNFHSFIGATLGDRYQDTEHGWHEKFWRAYQEGSQALWILATGRQDTESIQTRGWSLSCPSRCQATLPMTLGALAFFTTIITLSLLSLRRLSRDERKPLLFILLWTGSFFLVTVFVAYEIEVRYYLGIIPAFFVLIMQSTLVISRYFRSLSTILGLLFIGCLMILSNIEASYTFLDELNRSQFSAQDSRRDLRFGTEPKVTLGQLRAIARGAEARFTKETPVVISGESHYVKSLYVVLTQEFGFHGCYLRGTHRALPQNWHHIYIEEPAKHPELEPFGTLGAHFEPRKETAGMSPLPNNCLTY